MALIHLTQDSHLGTYWTKPLSDGTGDVMAMIWRDDGASPWRALIRFRYYEDGKVWNSKDRKSGYAVRLSGPDADTNAARDRLAATVDAALGLIPGPCRRVEINATIGTDDHVLRNLPGMYSRKEWIQ